MAQTKQHDIQSLYHDRGLRCPGPLTLHQGSGRILVPLIPAWRENLCQRLTRSDATCLMLAIKASTDRYAAEIVDDPISPTDITATIFDALGIDPRTLLQNLIGRVLPISTDRPIPRKFS